MPGAALNYVIENAREETTGDANFYRRMIYFFELIVPKEVALGQLDHFFFPLMIPPQSYELEEPFAVESTVTQGGGLYVEEQGIIDRYIRLRGTTGFKPRKIVKYTIAATACLKPETKSFDRSLPDIILEALSGQRHFQYLQDAVFRTYADLKRDPATAKDTQLIFHNPKDQESWLVAPQKFSLSRSSGNPTAYNYAIDLLVAGPAKDVKKSFSEDLPLLEQLRNMIAAVKNAIDLIAGAFNEIVALVNEIKNFVKGIISIISDIAKVIDAVKNFVEGFTELIELPYAFINAINDVIDSVLDFANTAEESAARIVALPDTCKQMFRQMGDGLEQLAMHPEAFETPDQAEMRKIKERQAASTSYTPEQLTALAASTPPSTYAALAAMGTAPLSGEVERAKIKFTAGAEIRQYSGSRAVTISRGDTLVNLAATYLGDARRWQDIAVANGLQPPFLDSQAGSDLGSEDENPLPGAAGVGKKILIPNYTKPVQMQTILPVLGVRQEEPIENHLLGTDLALEPVPGSIGLYDLAINTEHGATDLKQVSGIANISQALVTRLTIERGTDMLYKAVGLQRVVGTGISPVDIELGRFRIMEALTLDPRVAAVRNLDLIASEGQGDVVEVSASAELRGFTAPILIKTALAR